MAVKPQKIDIYLRSGQTITLSVRDWKVTKRGGAIEKFEWTMADTKTRMPYLALDEVVAVIERT